MIGPGWIPGYRPRMRTLGYTRLRRRARPRPMRPGPVTRTSTSDMVIFDHGPAEFPTATVLPREPRARAVALMAGLERWLAARWSWFKPRTVPCAVAMLGMVAVMASANYLAHQHDDVQPRTSGAVLIAPR